MKLKSTTLLIFLFGLFFCFNSMGLLAQTTSIKGLIQHNGQGLPYASVGIPGTSIGVMSDANGAFELLQVPLRDSLHLKVSCVGYLPYSTRLHLKSQTIPFLRISLEKDQKQLDEVVVTGTMQEVSKSESPVNVEIYTAKFFQKNPTPGIFEGLRIVNGVMPQLNCNVCNTGDIHINGMEGPYTMVLIDGMPIVSALSTVYGLSGIPMSMVQRIEIIKGPASTLYGSEAVGGLINVITKSAFGAPKLYADVSSSSWGEVNADLSTRISFPKASSLISLNYFNFQQRIDQNHDNFTDMTLQNHLSLFNKWAFTRKQGLSANLALRYLWEDRWGGDMRWNPSWRGSDSLYAESIYTQRVELIGNYDFRIASEKILFSYSYNYHDQNSWYGRTPYMGKQHVGYGQFTWNKAIRQHQLLAGLAMRYTWYLDNTPATKGFGADSLKQVPSIIYLPGVFVQDEITFNKRHKLLPGLRYDYNSVYGSIFSPRLNYKFSPDSNNTFRLSLGNGYRIVNVFTEDHAALTGARQVVFAEALKPERSYNVNLNYQHPFHRDAFFGNIDLTGFYTYFTNKIVGDFLADPKKIIYDNLRGYAISKGITLNLELNHTNGLKALVGGTLMDVYQVEQTPAGDNQRAPQLHAPRFQGTFTLSYFLKFLKLSTDLTGTVYSPMHLPVQTNDYRAEMSPWFCLMNLQLKRDFGKYVEIYGGVKNLLNFLPKDPLMRPFDPFNKSINDPLSNPYGYTFDTSYNYAPMQGLRGFLGLRVTVR